MGTFHDDHDERHGQTVAIFSHGPRTYVGRWDKQEGDFVLIRDAGFHEEGTSQESCAAWLEAQRRFGVKVEYPYLTVPSAEVARVVPLREAHLEDG